MRWLVAIAVMVAILAWAWRVEQVAESNARKFCDDVAVGSSFAALAAVAGSTGEDRLRLIRDNSILVGFTGISPFSRHLCEISGGGGKVLSKRYAYID